MTEMITITGCECSVRLAVVDLNGTPRLFDVCCHAAEGHMDRGILDCHVGHADALTEAGFDVVWADGAWPVRFITGVWKEE